ncbi:hypothetical protein [Aeromicrobium massiliense]|uniref:hypothetical protein n=1 Tax=Aeromicrobium massiliense TaxID=1464554 RepID=UPI0011C91D00|nr:hypothetical protein [Aeromicrobium massiliense]
MGTDKYGLPQGVLGPLPDDFFSCLGRVVCVSAVLEQQLEALYEQMALRGSPVGKQLPASECVQRCLKLVEELPAYARPRVHEYLVAVEGVLDKRNSLVHSAYPTATDGTVWGHKPSRKSAGGSFDAITIDVPALIVAIGEMGNLATDFGSVLALCGNRVR